MKTKIALGIGLLLWSVVLLAASFYGVFYLVTGLEMNDRLKYEAAYLKGYIDIQNKLKEKDYEGAETQMDFLIDAHVKTLEEFQFLESSMLSYEINQSLCKAVNLRKKYPRIPTGNQEEVTAWYAEIDLYLSIKGIDCGK